MNMQKYMTFTSQWQKLKEVDEDTQMADYEEPVDIKTFIYGKNVFIRENESHTTVSAKCYLTLENVSVGDLLDGQVIKSVSSYPESWNQDKQLYECLTWDS